MIVELSLITGVNYITYKYIARDFFRFKKDFDNLIERIPELKNNKDEKMKLITYKTEDYGFKIKLMLPKGITSDQLENNILAIKQALELTSTHLKIDNQLITLHGIKSYNFTDYEPVKLPSNKIIVGEFIGSKIIVDMNKFPHALVCGDTGTGKSRVLFTIITNLIFNTKKLDLYLLQVRKNDLVVFKNCSQVKCCSRTIDEVLESLQQIDHELQRREDLLDIEKGYLNIEEYNKKSGKYLRYTYVIIEEFSFLNVSKGDSKEDKAIKTECMKYIKSIVNAGRSSGVFLITSLQKPTSDSIPTDIKAQLTTRIALNILDKTTCSVVMGDNSAVGLAERELVCRTKGIEKGYGLTINFDDIKKYTESSQVKKQAKIKTEVKNTAIDIMKALGVWNYKIEI